MQPSPAELSCLWEPGEEMDMPFVLNFLLTTCQ
jgi:hypothetical protein